MRDVLIPDMQSQYPAPGANRGAVRELERTLGPRALDAKQALGVIGEFVDVLAPAQPAVQSEDRRGRPGNTSTFGYR